LIQVFDFEIDDDNRDKFASHGLTGEQVDEVLGNRFVVVRNRRGRRAPYLLIGRDNGGRCITIPIEPTTDPVVWRPVTAWPCKLSEEVRLRD
jgi:hypothetical protein